MKTITWTKYWTRNFSLFRHWVYIESNRLSFYKKNFGGIFDYSLTVPSGNLVEFYHDEKELEKMTNLIFSKSCRDYKTFDKYARQVIGWMQDFIDFNNDIKIGEIKSFSNSELAAYFKRWYQKYLYWQVGVYFFFVLEPIVTTTFLKSMESYLKKNGRGSEINIYSEIVMSPEVMNAVAEEQCFALKTAISIRRRPARKKEFINKYYRKFLWIPCYDVKDKEYGVEYFEKQISQLLKLSEEDLKQKLSGIQKEFTKRKSDFDGLLTKMNDKRLFELAKIMHWLIYYKDHRDDKRREASYTAKRFMSVLAGRFGLTLEEINYLTPPEVINWLKGKEIAKNKIRERMPANYVLLATPGKIDLFTGAEVDAAIKREMKKGELESSSIIKGTVGSKGKAKGRVTIVRHSVGLSKVKEGDVLVAVTTHPEYVPAMKKSCAIVTDEGGITSHAAIVAREMMKPCIVGTKNATKMLKDGDIVEVDTNHNSVKIVKN